MTTERLARLLATCGGIGYAPAGPGTAASLAAVVLAYSFVSVTAFPLIWLAALAVLAFGPAVWAAGVTARSLETADPSIVVIDEVVGQWLALSAASAGEWMHWAAAFALFRFFDIAKPFPLRRLERLPGGLGIVADDAAAGLCGIIMLASWRWFFD